jgi:hypothetical protein
MENPRLVNQMHDQTLRAKLDEAAAKSATTAEELRGAEKASAEKAAIVKVDGVGERGPGLYAVQNPVTGKVHFVTEGSEEDRLVPQRNRADRRRSIKSKSISKADRAAIKASHQERQREINATKRRLKAVMTGELTPDSKPVEE